MAGLKAAWAKLIKSWEKKTLTPAPICLLLLRRTRSQHTPVGFDKRRVKWLIYNAAVLGGLCRKQWGDARSAGRRESEGKSKHAAEVRVGWCFRKKETAVQWDFHTQLSHYACDDSFGTAAMLPHKRRPSVLTQHVWRPDSGQAGSD